MICDIGRQNGQEIWKISNSCEDLHSSVNEMTLPSERMEEQREAQRQHLERSIQGNPFFAIPPRLHSLAFGISFFIALVAGLDQGFLVMFGIMLVTFAISLTMLALGGKYGYIRRATPDEFLPRGMR